MRNAKLMIILLTAVAVAALIGAFTAFSGAQNGRKPVVKTARINGKSILVTRRGMTLYRLSVEKRGRFICRNAACLSLWKPLLLPAGKTPTGARFLGTVKRPDHGIQVTYRGGPVYTFVQDRKPGDMRGNGFKDVGIWHPVVVAGRAQPAPASSSSGYGY